MTSADKQLLQDALNAWSCWHLQLNSSSVTSFRNCSSNSSSNSSNSSKVLNVNATSHLIDKNLSTVDPFQETPDSLHNRYWVLIMLLVPMFTIFGNALVVLAVCRERALQTSTNRFIVSLAVADILVAAIVMPVSVYVEVRSGFWDFNNLLCDLWIMCDALFSTASILNLVAISIDRYIAVTKPIQYAKHSNSRRTTVTLCATWLLSAGIALPIGCGLQDAGGLRERNEFSHLCIFLNGDFLIYSSLGSFYIPCCVMLLLYYRIFSAIRRRSRKQLAAASSSSSRMQAAAGGGGGTPMESISQQADANTMASDNSQIVSDTVDTKADGGAAAAAAAQNGAQLLEEERQQQQPFKARNRTFPRIRLHRRVPRRMLERSASRRERKATKTLAIVLCVFLLCWLPFFITNMMWAACLKKIEDSEFFEGPLCAYDRHISVFIVWLGYMNSFMNPLIYTIFNCEFRKAFKKLLHID